MIRMRQPTESAVERPDGCPSAARGGFALEVSGPGMVRPFQLRKCHAASGLPPWATPGAVRRRFPGRGAVQYRRLASRALLRRPGETRLIYRSTRPATVPGETAAQPVFAFARARAPPGRNFARNRPA